MQKKYFRLLILFAVFSLNWACDEADNGDLDGEKVPVKVEPAQLGRITQTVAYNGDIHAEYEVKVFSKIPDRIEKFFVDDGDIITKGQPIAQITATTIEQGVRQAEAGLLAAKAQEANMRVEFERAKRLFSENALSRQQYDALETQYEAAQAQVEQSQAATVSAKSMLNDATLTAPISGIIGKKYYENGDMANPALPVVSIVQMEQVKVSFNVTEVDMGKLEIGQTAFVKVRSFENRIFEGKVHKISPVLDPQTRMGEVDVLIKNPDKKLKPGMYADVEVITGTIDGVIVIPRFSTIESTTLERVAGKDEIIKNFYVYAVEQNHAVQKKLDVRYVNHRYIAVESGISVGDSLVVSGQNNLRDGFSVAVID